MISRTPSSSQSIHEQPTQRATESESPSHQTTENDYSNTTVGKYQILELIGRGGSALVYRAWDTILKRSVAIKILLSNSPHEIVLIQSFVREAEITAKLHHPNIVTLFDFIEVNGRGALVMEYFPGLSLSQFLKKSNGLSENIALMITAEILRGLRVAHQAGLVHADIKPSNVLVHPELGVKVSDFGVCRPIELTTQEPNAPGFLGTLLFASPEQIQDKPFDHRSDLFSVGLTLYTLITKSYAFGDPAETYRSVRSKLENQSFDFSRLKHSRLSRCCEQILNRALQLDPDQRYPSADLMLAAIEQLLAERDLLPYNKHLNDCFSAAKPLQNSSWPRMTRRHWKMLLLIVLSAILAVRAITVWMKMNAPPIEDKTIRHEVIHKWSKTLTVPD